MITAQELKDFGAGIKNLPPEKRRAAGLRFKEMQAALAAIVDVGLVCKVRVVDKKGEELWSHCRGTPGEIVGYENCVVLPSGIVWGENLKFVRS
jgi:hypothetical protein